MSVFANHLLSDLGFKTVNRRKRDNQSKCAYAHAAHAEQANQRNKEAFSLRPQVSPSYFQFKSKVQNSITLTRITCSIFFMESIKVCGTAASMSIKL